MVANSPLVGPVNDPSLVISHGRIGRDELRNLVECRDIAAEVGRAAPVIADRQRLCPARRQQQQRHQPRQRRAPAPARPLPQRLRAQRHRAPGHQAGIGAAFHIAVLIRLAEA